MTATAVTRGKLLPIMSAFSRETFGDGKDAINAWMSTLDYKKVVNEDRLGPSIGEDRERSLGEIADCEKRNQSSLKKDFDTNRGQQPRGLVADAMRCASCHQQGKETYPLKRKDLSQRSFGDVLTDSIDQGWMPSHAKIQLTKYEKNLLKLCLRDEFFGTSQAIGTFNQWLREKSCEKISSEKERFLIEKTSR